MQSQLHRAAQAFAEAGIPVFPCVPDGKQPATANGFKDASADLAQINIWWGENPQYNLALCPHDAGWCVVDLDPPIGEQSWLDFLDANGELEPETYVVRTPRGGRHLYFAGELPPTSSKIGKKIDTRGTGSYVLVPPSIVGGKTYVIENETRPRNLPSYISEAATRSHAKAAAASYELDTPTNLARADAFITACLLRSDVAIEGQGGDARTYAMCAEILNLGLSPLKTLEYLTEKWNPHCIPPWSDEELRIKVENAANYAQNEPGAWAVAPASEVFGDALDKLPPRTERERQSRYKLLSLSDILALPVPSWLVRDLLPARSTAMLVGITGSYKTFLALDMGLSIATGKEVFGVIPEQGPVVYATGEGLFGFKNRVLAWSLQHEIELPFPNFHITAAPMIAADGHMQEFGDEIANCLGSQKPKLIVLDTVAKCMIGLNENDASDAGKFIRFCDSLVEAFGCTVLALHHKSDKANAADYRGTSAFRAGIDTYLEVITTRATRAVEVYTRQHKDAEEREGPWTFQGRVLGPSLVFNPTTLEQHRELTSKEDHLAPKKIGAALQKLNARGEANGVTTAVLAAELHQGVENETQEQRGFAIVTLCRKLGALSQTKLAAYCSRTSSGIIWWLPI